MSQYVGGNPILNKFACLQKGKWDSASNEWVVKRRLIMDSKRSSVKEASNKEYRSILQRISDTSNDIMSLLDSADESQHLQMLVLEASEAYLFADVSENTTAVRSGHAVRRGMCAIRARPRAPEAHL